MGRQAFRVGWVSFAYHLLLCRTHTVADLFFCIVDYRGESVVQLVRFQGRPNDLSPKARYHLFLAKLFPESYACVRRRDERNICLHNS
jgi:Cytochrome c/c1 heme lyase